MTATTGCCEQQYVCAETGALNCDVHGPHVGYDQCCTDSSCPRETLPSRSEVWHQQIRSERYRAKPLAALHSMTDRDLNIAAQAFDEGAGVTFWWVKDDPVRSGTPMNPYADEADDRKAAGIQVRDATARELRRAKREAARIYGFNVPGWVRRRRLRKRFARPH